jgi:hypothetical protein
MRVVSGGWRLGGFLLALAGLLAAGPALAGDPAAIVEEVSAPSVGLQVMDYVGAGQVIALKPGESITLGYLASCQRERISGGTISVGATESKVAGGTLQRSRVECDGGALQLSADQAAKSGVIVFRKKPAKQTDAAGKPLPAPALTLYSVYPVIDLGAPGSLTVERLDAAQPPLQLSVTQRWVDLAAQHRKLAPGGLYRATAAGHSLVFRIDPGAHQSGGPVVGRLVRL